MASRIREWVVDRFALRPVYDGFLDRRVPKAPWYTGDGSALLTLLGIQVLTGAVLLLTYSPSADAAYESVVYITDVQTLGWFIRGLHYWSAGMMMIVLFYHLFRQILFGGYKSPREGTWIIGVLLFFCVLLMAYTGYLLRWDERAVYGIRVMLHMLIRVPLIGESLVLFVQGGPELGPRTLTRLYAVHVFLVPLLMFLLVGAHLHLVVQRGTITRAERRQPVATAEEQKRLYKEEAESPDEGETFYPDTTFKAAVFSAVVLAIPVTLAILVGPQQLMREANLVERSMPAEEWWYWWYSGLIALLPPAVAPWFVVVFPILAFVVLMALPFVDRSPARGFRKRLGWAVVVAALVAALLALTDYRRRSGFTGWPDPNPPVVPIGFELTPSAERGRILFAQYGCNSCHPIAGMGPQIGTDFAKLVTPRSLTELREYILQPPPEIPMPSYEGRLTDQDLEDVVAFCHVAQTFARRP